MKQRCNNSKHKRYPDYGGRGIGICEEWNVPNGYEKFLNDIGKRPSNKYSIDRINNDGNYEPKNVRWATVKEQNNNKRDIPHPSKLMIEPGTRFGMMTILNETDPYIKKSGKKVRMFTCQCDCGEIRDVQLFHLTSGHTKSCGCQWGRNKKIKD